MKGYYRTLPCYHEYYSILSSLANMLFRSTTSHIHSWVPHGTGKSTGIPLVSDVNVPTAIYLNTIGDQVFFHIQTVSDV